MNNPAHPVFNTPIPAQWVLTKVDNIKSPEKSSCVAGPFGSNIGRKYFVPSGIPVIRGSNLTVDLTRFVPKGFVFVSEERAQHYRAQHVRGGDLVFTCWGTIGQVGLIPNNGPFREYIISNKQLKLRPDNEIADPFFLFYYFASQQMVTYIRNRAIGAAVPGINLGILKELPVVLPPRPIQDRIVSVLSAYDDMIENNFRRIQILEEMAQALYREWFVEFRFPGCEKAKPEGSSIDPLPSGWKIGAVRDFGQVVTGKTPSKKRPEFFGGEVPFIKTPDMHGNIYVIDTAESLSVQGAESQANKTIPAGSLMVTCIGTVGIVAIVSRPSQTNQQINSVLLHQPYDREYLFFALRQLRQTISDHAAVGATMSNLSKGKFEALNVARPPATLVRAFSDTVGPMFVMVHNLQLRVRTLRDCRDLLLPKLISGELDVSNLEIAAGEAA